MTFKYFVVAFFCILFLINAYIKCNGYAEFSSWWEVFVPLIMMVITLIVFYVSDKVKEKLDKENMDD